ncbi:hypothetical protein [Oceanomicrobium pacificus]|uniref:Sulfotransferase domain-containing protein n=1 Tax=Oceanomicrobium pacificus TaxID=2692916 RepID=A0A6B0TWS2_9RHOB|nr:hypothetical protein [Oceanomicrobium pacificus]MXU66175.1 hypothetical protein [Oceanomicrobium pacificus]
MQPLVYISYGMTKCGSTFAFELVRTGLERAGIDQSPLPAGCGAQGSKINFISHVSDDEVAALAAEAARRGGPVAVKTHTRPDPPLAALLRQGRAVGHAAIRDPRDMALSMMDHGARAQRDGRPAFSEITDLDAARNGIRNQCDSLTGWLALPGMVPLPFGRLVGHSTAVLQGAFAQLGLPMTDAEADATVAQVLDTRFIQFNRGRQDRWRTDMAPLEAQAFGAEFAPLFDLLDRSAGLDYPIATPVLGAGESLRLPERQEPDRPERAPAQQETDR